MRAWLLLLVALTAALAGCQSKRTPAPAASARLPEATAPSGLVAELSIGNPKQTWAALRRLGGGTAQALPSSLPVLLATALEIAPTAASSLDEAVPMVGALLSRSDAPEPDLILGMHVVSGAELVASLTLGSDAKLRRVELGPRVVRLVPAPGAREPPYALGVSGNYLLLSTRVDALRDAGRFVAEGVSSRARTAPGIALSAKRQVLQEKLVPRLRELWQVRRAALAERDQAVRQQKGRAPDFADPEVILGGVDSTLELWLGVLESAAELTLSATPLDDRLRLELSLVPGADGKAAAFSREAAVGPLTPLLNLPAATRAALLWRSDDVSPAASAAAALAQLFGARLDAAQTRRMSAALDAFARCRRGATTLALTSGPAPALLVSTELGDAAAFPDAVKGVLSLLDLPPVAAWFASSLGKPRLVLSKPQGAGRSAKVYFERPVGGPSSSLPKVLSVSWDTDGALGRIRLAPESAADGRGEPAGPTLSSLDFLARGGGLADQSALAAFLDLAWLGAAPEPAPLLLTFGKSDQRIAGVLDVSAGALPTVMRLFALKGSP